MFNANQECYFDMTTFFFFTVKITTYFKNAKCQDSCRRNDALLSCNSHRVSVYWRRIRISFQLLSVEQIIWVAFHNLAGIVTRSFRQSWRISWGRGFEMRWLEASVYLTTWCCHPQVSQFRWCPKFWPNKNGFWWLWLHVRSCEKPCLCICGDDVYWYTSSFVHRGISPLGARSMGSQSSSGMSGRGSSGTPDQSEPESNQNQATTPRSRRGTERASASEEDVDLAQVLAYLLRR